MDTFNEPPSVKLLPVSAEEPVHRHRDVQHSGSDTLRPNCEPQEDEQSEPYKYQASLGCEGDFHARPKAAYQA